MIFNELSVALTIFLSVVCTGCNVYFEIVRSIISKPTFDLRVDRQFNLEFAWGLRFKIFPNTSWEFFIVMLDVFVWIATLQPTH